MTTPARYPDVRLSVVIPAYNEASNLEQTLPRAVASLRRLVGAFELILIDDCSRDETYQVASTMSARFPELRVFRNEVNLRQGGTLERGFKLAAHDLVMHNAADYPFDFEDLPLLLEHFPAADLVVAARRSYPGTSAPRRFVSFANRALLRLLFGADLRDYNFIQIYRRQFLQGQPTLSRATSFITPEKIIRAIRLGQRVVEVEVDYHRRLVGQPSSASWSNIRAALRDMGRLWLEFRRADARRLWETRSGLGRDG